MKKSLLALAVLGAFAGAAQAQNSVTVYGIVDGGARYTNNINLATGGTGAKWAAASGTNLSNRWGFKGTEDLGGGMNAHFNLEGGFKTGTGVLGGATQANVYGATAAAQSTPSLFDRSAFVGLGGSWGSVDLGLQYSVAFKTLGAIDPLGFQYITITPLALEAAGNQVIAGLTPGIGATRFQNDIQYSNTTGPLTVRAEYALGEQAGATSSGAAEAVGAVYADGPFTVAGAYTSRKPTLAVAPAALNFQNNTQWTLGGAYATGPFRVALGYMDEKQDLNAVGGQSEKKNTWVGGSYALSDAVKFSAGYYQTKVSSGTAEATRKLLIVGGNYSLSKRTTLYADIDHANFSGNVNFGTGAFAPSVSPYFAQQAGQSGQTGFTVGMNHAF